MKFFLIIIILCLAVSLSAKDNFSIKCKIENYKNYKKAYLYDYNNGKYNLFDTANVLDGSIVFQLTKYNHPGIYKIRLSPDMVIENILFNYEDIELKADYNKLPESINYIKSDENILLTEYLSFINTEAAREKALAFLLTMYGRNDIFYIDITKEMKRLKIVNRIKINSMADNNKNLMTAKYIRFEQFPDMYDSIGNRQYLAKHFWDNIDFSDTLLLYFPFFTSKIDGYLSIYEDKKVERAEQEMIFREPSDFILTNAAANRNVFEFTFEKLLNDADVFGLYDLYAYIAEKYSSNDFCINEDRKKEIESKLDKIQSLKIGSQAPEIKITDDLLLSKIDKDFTLIVFWESSCPKCFNVLKDIIPVYEKFKKKKLEVFAIALDKNETDYKKAIIERGYKWINICDFKSWNSPLVYNYNVSITPSMFLLDRNKKIISRPVSINHVLNKLK